MAPKRVEDSTDELVEDDPQEFEITEVQFPGIADGIALGLSKPDDDFNFRMGNSTFPVGRHTVAQNVQKVAKKGKIKCLRICFFTW